MTEIPNPGSAEAISQGCICPVLDNGRGKGYLGQSDLFYIVISCPVHKGWSPNE